MRCSAPFAATTLALAALVLLGDGCQVVEKIYSAFDRTGKLDEERQVGYWEYNFQSGATMAAGEYRDDKQFGPWTYWYENGNVEWRGTFGTNRLEGESFFGREDGTKHAVGMFFNGFEEDLWTFWDAEGQLEHEGDYVRGRAGLRWTTFHTDGSILGEGYRLDGERIGLWQFFDGDGELSESRFPVPEGVEIVHEAWPGGSPRREGLLLDGRPDGRWATWHKNGRRRLSATFAAGKAHGYWHAWDESGRPLLRGTMLRGAPAGEWSVWRGGVAETLPASSLDLTSATGPESLLGAWREELRAKPYATVDLAPDPSTPSPTREQLERTELAPSLALRPQPWTVRESKALQLLVDRYSEGDRAGARARGGAYGAARRDSPRGDPELSPRFLGTTLPWTRFYRANGDVVDLDDFRGRNKVVLVVLRGFVREVCVYCVTQTEALCDNYDDFVNAGADVFVLYPGERNRLETFMDSFSKVSKLSGAPPIGVLYDPDSRLVERMGIEAELAIPSTFVLDEDGVVRFSYVGTSIDDRPAAKDVLEAVRELR